MMEQALLLGSDWLLVCHLHNSSFSTSSMMQISLLALLLLMTLIYYSR